MKIRKTRIEDAEKYAKKKGENSVILYPTIMAEKFYLKNGYKKTKEFTIWEIADKQYKIFKMEKRL